MNIIRSCAYVYDEQIDNENIKQIKLIEDLLDSYYKAKFTFPSPEDRIKLAKSYCETIKTALEK